MFCSICQHPRQAEMIIDYAYSCSLRATAMRFGAGYRSLQRHLKYCIVFVMAEKEQKKYEREFKENAELLRLYYAELYRPRRPKSIIKKPVEFTWSRRSWKKRAKNGAKTPEKHPK